MEEPLMNLRPQSEAEKLLWERQKNMELTEELRIVKFNLGVLQTELEELKHEMKTEEVGALILKNKKLKQTLKDKEEQCKEQKKEIEQLFDRIVKLQTPSK
jgi:regulator of replication initiation timing